MPTEAIQKFLMRPSDGGAYTDERLAMLLAHAQDGKLAFYSCCCLLGIPNADHALQGRATSEDYFISARAAHLLEARDRKDAEQVEREFKSLSPADEGRRARLIPLILAELDRRSSLTEPQTELSLETVNEESPSPASLTERSDSLSLSLIYMKE